MELLTTAETENLQDWDLGQIINGKDLEMPSPLLKHQKISRILQRMIEDFLLKNNLGELFNAPLDVIFEEGVNRLQPDLIFISNENKGIIKDWIRGVPDLLVEVVSKGSFYIDTVDKKAIYEKYGVKEYWIVFPEYDTIEVFTLENGTYKMFSRGTDAELVKSNLLAGLEVKVSDVTN